MCGRTCKSAAWSTSAFPTWIHNLVVGPVANQAWYLTIFSNHQQAVLVFSNSQSILSHVTRAAVTYQPGVSSTKDCQGIDTAVGRSTYGASECPSPVWGSKVSGSGWSLLWPLSTGSLNVCSMYCVLILSKTLRSFVDTSFWWSVLAVANINPVPADNVDLRLTGNHSGHSSTRHPPSAQETRAA